MASAAKRRKAASHDAAHGRPKRRTLRIAELQQKVYVPPPAPGVDWSNSQIAAAKNISISTIWRLERRDLTFPRAYEPVPGHPRRPSLEVQAYFELKRVAPPTTATTAT